MTQRIQLKRGTSEEWSLADPVLLAGEQGYETDTRRIKVGNGVARWSALGYITSEAVSIDWESISNIPSAITPLQHASSHGTGGNDAISPSSIGAQPAGNYSVDGHGHEISDIANLSTSLASLASSNHSHEISNITGLQDALDGKQDSGNYTLAGHEHVIANITGLQDALNSKASSSSLATVATSGNYGDLSGVPTDFSPSAHSHLKSNITDLSTSDLDLSGKRCLFANMYATLGDLPSATTYHGMFAHVHETGAAYFAHNGSWVRVQNYDDAANSTGISWSLPPENSSSAGSPGDVSYDNNFLYIRTSQEWKRLALQPIVGEIVISQQPANATVNVGAQATFTVATSTEGSFSYQWSSSSDGLSFSAINGATSSTLTINATLSDNGSQYRAVLSADGFNDATTNIATLTVNDTFRIMTEGGDDLLTEGGDAIAHDGIAQYVTITQQPSNANATQAVGDWSQLGSDIDGGGVYTAIGSTVSISSDGSRVAIGGVSGRLVRVYEWSGSAWVQLGFDLYGEFPQDGFGRAVSISSDGSRLAIGAPSGDNGTVTNSGYVSIYDWSGSAWVQVGSNIDGESISDYSGTTVAISGDGSRVAIGARWNDGNGTSAGHVRVYEWSNMVSAWVRLGSDIDGEAAYDLSSESIAISSDGSRVAIGAPGNDGNGDASGHVRIYDWSGSAWVQAGSDIDGETEINGSGRAVALSSDGSRVAIGADYNDGNGTYSGHVRVYRWTGSGWSQLGADIDGEAADDRSGSAVAISSDGSRVAIGAFQNDGGGSDSGHVRIYDWSGSAWVQVGSDIDGEAAGDHSGIAVAISSDGSRLAIGGSLNDGGGNGAGHVRIYASPTTATATFSVVATSSDGSAITYQWQKSDDGVNFSNIDGATSSTLALNGLTAANDNGDKYRVIVDTASAVPVASSAVTLTVT